MEFWRYDTVAGFLYPDTDFLFSKVHRICFALSLFHFLLGLALIGVKDTRDKRAAVQNGSVNPY